MEARELTLPDGSWQILVDGEDSFLWKKEIRITKKAMVPSKSALLLGK
jgi:hypothetical protein